MAASAVLTLGLKHLIERSRPPAAMVVGAIDHGFSFPSGHTLTSTVFFGLLAGLALHHAGTRWRRAGIVALWLFASVAMAASRVYLGYHWFTDVLGGFSLGVAVLAATALAWLLLRDRVPLRKWNRSGHPAETLGADAAPAGA